MLADNSFLICIVIEVEREAADGKEAIRISEKIVDLIKGTSEKLMEGAQLSIGSRMIINEMLENALRFGSEAFMLKDDRK